jgi:uncharacterized protein
MSTLAMSEPNLSGLGQMRAMVRPPCPVLDIHVHPLDCFGALRPVDVADDAGRLWQAAQRAGIDRVCVFSLHTSTPYEPTPAQCVEANDYVLRLRDCRPDFFLPFCYVSPAYPDEALKEIERCVGGADMVGIKLWVARRASDAGMDPIAAAAAAADVPILQHAWSKTVGQLPGESYPADVAVLARRHPRTRIVMAHLNGVNPRGLEAVVDCPNISVDISGGDPESGMIELAVRRLGSQRVVFGSDMPIRHFSVSLAKVIGAGIDAAARRDILWNNAARLLPQRAGVALLPDEG